MSASPGGAGGGSGRNGSGGNGGLAGPNTQLFREQTAAPVWLRVVGVIALVAAVVLAVDATALDPGSFQGGSTVAAVVGVVVLIAVGLLALTVRIVILVDVAAITLALSPVWRVRFDRADIGSAKKVDIVAREFGGAGYRVLPGNKRGLLFTSGSGVAVLRTSTGVSYTVRTDRPDELLAAIYRR
ncbi:hypothetical protein [Subtercola lobariae]|uniref:DUF1648 domain-containing protein n=1 Tax=Subtercola lobariae TaxID=1588641 RepID=A0A917EYA1_9MICO|nr:hypothetical protein [Subtercola lobariae]GGF30152.1 hypothetical protein GCM10011399_24190 [Subtercola lobariae]